MQKTGALFLALLTVAPFVYMVFFVCNFMVAFSNRNPEGAVPFENLIYMHLGTMALIMILLFAYILIVLRSNRIPNEQRVLWILVLFVGNLLAFPIFWYLFVWRKPKDRRGLI